MTPPLRSAWPSFCCNSGSGCMTALQIPRGLRRFGQQDLEPRQFAVPFDESGLWPQDFHGMGIEIPYRLRHGPAMAIDEERRALHVLAHVPRQVDLPHCFGGYGLDIATRIEA